MDVGRKQKFCSKSHDNLFRFPSITSLLRKVTINKNPKEYLSSEHLANPAVHSSLISSVSRILRPRSLKIRVGNRLKTTLQSSQSQCTSLNLLPTKPSFSHNSSVLHLSPTPIIATTSLEIPQVREAQSALSLNFSQENSTNECQSIKSFNFNDYEVCLQKADPGVPERNLPERSETAGELHGTNLFHSNLLDNNPSTHLKIHIIRLLGSGANGFCHEVNIQRLQMNTSAQVYPEVPNKCTLKVIPRRSFINKRTAIQREIHIQRQLQHPYLVRLFLAYYESRMKAICLLLDYCSMGSLTDLLDAAPHYRTQANSDQSLRINQTSDETMRMLYDPRTGGLSMMIAKPIFRGLMVALNHLHEQYGIVHRDIKPSNILLADGFIPKLSDFGLACTEQQCWIEKQRICGTPNYLAPEIFLKDGHSKSSDCWAAGATLYYMVSGRPPFDERQPLRGSRIYREGSIRALQNSVRSATTSKARIRLICRHLLWGRYEFPVFLDQSVRQIIRHLLLRRPEDRSTAAEVLQMRFCRSVRRLASVSNSRNGEYEAPTDVGHSTDSNWTGEKRSSLSGRSPVEYVPNSVTTGTEAIFDIFRLLGNRVPVVEDAGIIKFHWVSRWALSKQNLIYYTMDHEYVSVPPCETMEPDEMAHETQTSFHWGATSRQGRGIINYNNRLLHFEKATSNDEECSDTFPTVNEVRLQCETLTQQLSHYKPLNTPQLRTNSVQTELDRTTFVQRWKEHGNNLLFAFSSGGWQVNFHDHSKVIVHYPHVMVHSDAESRNSTVTIVQNDVALDLAFRQWVANHQQNGKIIQYLLFELL